MFKFEKKVLEWIETHILLVCVIGVTLLGLCIRYSLRNALNWDSKGCLLPWYETIRENGGLSGLKEQVGNYNVLYQFLIALMTYIPINPLYAYKILSCIFDFLLAAGVGYMVYDLSSDGRGKKAVLAYTLVVCSPIVYLNSASWAQCDAIYTFFMIASLIFLFRERFIPAFLLLGLAFAFKLQAVFLLPFFLFYYFVKKKYTVLYFGLIPVMMFVTGIPALIMGRNIGDILVVYLDQTDYFKVMANNAPSIWALFAGSGSGECYESMKYSAIGLTIAVLGCLMAAWVIKRVRMSRANMVFMAFLLSYTCVLFLPAMHERYGYFYEILAIIIVFLEKKTIPLAVSLAGISLVTYGSFLFDREISLSVLAAVNLVVYTAYVFILMRRLFEGPEKSGVLESDAV